MKLGMVEQTVTEAAVLVKQRTGCRKSLVTCAFTLHVKSLYQRVTVSCLYRELWRDEALTAANGKWRNERANKL